MIFRIVLSAIVIFLSTCIVYAVTIKITAGPHQVVITGWDYLKTDGQEIEISVPNGSISIISKAVIPVSKGR